MNGASKILTVSYGTFSCTLEGFDEPFNTMKAIAEYFRDLASEDRYFGAEPPTPDAAMLHRIAEREIQRRVDAKINENGVVLRADHSMPAVAQAPVAQAPVAQPAPVQPQFTQPVPTLVEAPAAETVASRLSRLRSESAAPVVLASDYIEDEHAELIAPQPATEVAPPAWTEPEPAIQIAPAPQAVAEDDNTGADEILVGLDAALAASKSVAAAAAAAPAQPVQVEPQDALIEAAFDIPEALVADAQPQAAQPIATEAVDSDFDLSDLLADAVAADRAPVDPDLSAVTAAPVAETEVDLADLLPESIDEPAVSDDPADQIPELSVVESYTDAADDFAETADDASEEPDEEFANDDDVLARLADDFNAPAAPDAVAHEVYDDEADETPTIEAIAPAIREVAPVLPPAAPVVPAVSDKLQRARARVIHVRRSPTMDAAAPAPVNTDDDLQRQLASLAEESLRGAARASDDAIATEAAPSDQHPRLAPEADAAAVERLIAQTNTAMAGPENKRRLSAIAHLKAAVAATLADRLSRSPSTEDAPSREDAYRDDLERVVRPQRPTLAETSEQAPEAEMPAARPAGDRPTPLVLISEQRIDRISRPAAPARIVPVRPRRVSPAAAAVVRPVPAPQPLILGEDEDDTVEDTAELFADTRGFAEFAEKLGATDLAGMLEAAAAYAACVEGRPHFSRPQLIRQVAAVAEAEITREDSLRSFGRLLRDGRIVKLRRGQFALTDRSHLLAEAKKIAG